MLRVNLKHRVLSIESMEHILDPAQRTRPAATLQLFGMD